MPADDRPGIGLLWLLVSKQVAKHTMCRVKTTSNECIKYLSVQFHCQNGVVVGVVAYLCALLEVIHKQLPPVVLCDKGH